MVNHVQHFQFPRFWFAPALDLNVFEDLLALIVIGHASENVRQRVTFALQMGGNQEQMAGKVGLAFIQFADAVFTE